jgi:hypothetical protein
MKIPQMIAMAFLAVFSVALTAGERGEDMQVLSDQLDENLLAAEDLAAIAEDTKAKIKDLSELIAAKGQPSSVWVSPWWSGDWGKDTWELYILNLGSVAVEVEVSYFNIFGSLQGVENVGTIQPYSTGTSSQYGVSGPPPNELVGSGWVQVVASGDVLVDGWAKEDTYKDQSGASGTAFVELRTMTWYPLAEALEY